MEEYIRQAYKSKGNFGKQTTSTRRSMLKEERREKRNEMRQKKRNIPDMTSDEIKSTSFTQSPPKISPKRNPRLELLKKWQEEKRKRQQEEKKNKKPVFKVHHVDNKYKPNIEESLYYIKGKKILEKTISSKQTKVVDSSSAVKRVAKREEVPSISKTQNLPVKRNINFKSSRPDLLEKFKNSNSKSRSINQAQQIKEIKIETPVDNNTNSTEIATNEEKDTQNDNINVDDQYSEIFSGACLGSSTAIKPISSRKSKDKSGDTVAIRKTPRKSIRAPLKFSPCSGGFYEKRTRCEKSVEHKTKRTPKNRKVSTFFPFYEENVAGPSDQTENQSSEFTAEKLHSVERKTKKTPKNSISSPYQFDVEDIAGPSTSSRTLETKLSKTPKKSKRNKSPASTKRQKIDEIVINNHNEPENDSTNSFVKPRRSNRNKKSPFVIFDSQPKDCANSRRSIFEAEKTEWRLILNENFEEKTPKSTKRKKQSSDDKSIYKTPDSIRVPDDEVFYSVKKDDNPIVYVSPFVTSSRGKEAARREYQQRKSMDACQNSSRVSSHERSPKAASAYFTKILNDEISKIQEKCAFWMEYKEHNDLTEDAQGLIDMTIGQSNLLISKKFQQFRGLINKCMNQDCSEMKIQCEDLHGFWDMIYKQVTDLDKRFENLDQMKANNWLENIPKKKTPKVVKKKKRPSKSVTTASSLLREAIQAARKKKTSEGDDFQVGLHSNLQIEILTPSRGILKSENSKSEKRKTVVFKDARKSCGDKENSFTPKSLRESTPLPTRRSERLSSSRFKLNFE